MVKVFSLILIVLNTFFSVRATAKAKNEDRDNSHSIFGFSLMSNEDQVGFGVDFGYLKPRGFGWGLAVRIKGAGAEDSGISYQTAKNYFGDSEVNTKYSLTILSFGKSYGFNDNLFIIVSGGIESYSKLVEFYDPTGILGNGGKYHVLKETSTRLIPEISLIYSAPGRPFYLIVGDTFGYGGMFFGGGWTW